MAHELQLKRRLILGLCELHAVFRVAGPEAWT